MNEKQQLKELLINEFNYDKGEADKLSLSELKEEYDNITDTSWMHPNETDEEFFEHEDF